MEGMRRFEAGQEVDGRYRLLARAGSGGMADVWVADDTMLQRRVALKFLHERFSQDQQFVERFRREASAAGGLQHPNVVGVYDRGEWEGIHYIAMEYVEGASLRDLIARGLSVGESVEIVRQILAGAQFAHEKGIVHRDLKPGNVLVDAEGRARVTDFGIARAGASEITQTGSVLGTAHYLSPEQAQGLEVTESTDIYSTGVILYEALTGQVPFDGDSAVTIALKQVSERPRSPSELNPNVSPALAAVVLRALAKDPANRFASAAEFARALDAAEADPTGGALGDTAAYGAVAAGAAGGLAAGALAAGADPAEAAMASEQQAAQAEEERRGWMTRKRALIIAAVLLLLGGVAAFALTRPETVVVPNVTGDDADEARADLLERGFDVATREEPSCQEPGTVAEQDPGNGARVDEGSTVKLVVSDGIEVEVPDVENLRADKAADELQAAELRPKPREQFSKRAKRGNAIGTIPSQGAQVPCQSRVTLLISKGADLVLLPDVLGLQREEAEAQLERRDFIVDVDTRDADQPEGEVIGQDPGGGSRLKRGTTITIIVSTGAGSVIVPSVIGQTEVAAAANLTGRGLNVSIQTETTEDESEDGRVIDQAPGGGTRVIMGEQVTIVVGEFEEPPEEEPPPEEPPPEEEPPPPDDETNPKTARR